MITVKTCPNCDKIHLPLELKNRIKNGEEIKIKVEPFFTGICYNVLRWGTGAINVDACRIPFKKDDDIYAKNPHTVRTPETYEYSSRDFLEGSKSNESKYDVPSKGRFPANLIISNGALDTGKTTKSRKRPVPKGDINDLKPRQYGSYGAYRPKQYESGVNDEGSPYRFFDLDAWSEHHGFLDVAKPSRAERDFGLDYFPLKNQRKQDGSWGSHEIFEVEGSGRKTGTLNRNYHPTVKPVKLMAFLITLGCPPKGIVVDPFLGSGTTCIAAKKLRRQWIGIEINPEYADIARARIDIKGPLDQYMEAEK